MIVRLLGLLDITAALVLFLMKFGVGETFGILFGIYLILKGLIFFSLVGIIDTVVGIFLILGGLGNYIGFSWIFVFWLIQKGFVSLYS